MAAVPSGSTPVRPTRDLVLPIVVAGDAVWQTARVETQDKQSRTRIATNLSVESHDFVTGAPLIEHLVRECCVTLLHQNDSAPICPNANDTALSLLKTRIKKKQDAAKAKVLGLVSSLEASSLTPQDKRALLGRRDHITLTEDREHCPERHYWVTSQHCSRSSKQQQAPFKQAFPTQDCQLVLSLDYDRFGAKEIPEYFDTFNASRVKQLVVRANFRPNDFDRDQRETSRAIAANIHDFTQELTEAKIKVAVIGTETLRACIRSISLRVHWTRTISDILSSLASIIAYEDKSHPLSFLKHMTHLVVTGSCDGALLLTLPQNLSHHPQQISLDTLFIADPGTLEGDFAGRFHGLTKGTESLVTSAVSVELASNRPATWAFKEDHRTDDAAPGAGADNKFVPNSLFRTSQLKTAVIHGIKCSRFFQAHGFYRPNKAITGLQNYLTSDDARALDSVIAALAEDPHVDGLLKLGNLTNSILRWLTGRLASPNYLMRINSLFFQNENIETCPTLPFGDICDILLHGYPIMGSIEPNAFLAREPRTKAIEASRIVSNAYEAAGWLSISSIPTLFSSGSVQNATTWNVKASAGGQAATDLAFQVSRFDDPWWSMREVFVSKMLEAAQAAHIAVYGRGSFSESIRNEYESDLCMIIAETILRFGHSRLNRQDEKLEKAFDTKVLGVLCFRAAQNRPGKYGEEVYKKLLFTNDEAARMWLSHFLASALRRPYDGAMVNTSELERRLKEGFSARSVEDWCSFFGKVSGELDEWKWMRHPIFGSVFGMMSEYRVGKLTSVDRRDSQFYREFEERVRGYVASSIRSPLNILVCGPAGSGKSFAVKQILPAVFGDDRKLSFLVYNLAQFSGPRDLTEAFLEIQDVSLAGSFPVVFWDEYDTTLQGDELGWLSYFLGPMQDGQFFHGMKSKNLPKCVFVFAGSMFNSFGEMLALDHAAKQSEDIQRVFDKDLLNRLAPDRRPLEFFGKRPSLDWNDIESIGRFSPDSWLKSKGPDFKSRLTCNMDIGTIGALPMTPISIAKGKTVQANLNLVQGKHSEVFRRASTLRTACELGAQGVFSGSDPAKSELMASLPFIDALLGCGSYEHGRRSVENLIQMSQLRDRGRLETSVTPSGSQARGHIRPNLLDRSRG